jgi:hypothetical protein
MAGVRIRWRGVARAAAIVVVGLIALRLLPGLLRAPEPPPLAADVGLPRAKPAAEAKPMVAVVDREAKAAVVKRRPKPRRKTHKRAHAVPDEPASTASIGTRKKQRRPPRCRDRPHRKATVSSSPEPVESTSPTAPEYVPPPAPEPSPEPAPTAPTTPGDGSQEFAPH